MPKTIIVAGHGPGISSAVAHRFGGAGHAVALVGRSEARLAAAAEELGAAGIRARAFPADLAEPAAMGKLVADVRERLGPIDVLHWNAPAVGAGDLTKDDPLALHAAFAVSVTSLVAAVQHALDDLRAAGDGSVLVTNGAVALTDPKLDALAVEQGFMGAAVAKTAQHKVVTLLAKKLAADGVYVGEVVVAGIVRGTAYDTGGGGGFLTADEVATHFWRLHSERPASFVSYLGVGLAGRGRP